MKIRAEGLSTKEMGVHFKGNNTVFIRNMEGYQVIWHNVREKEGINEEYWILKLDYNGFSALFDI